MDGRTGRGLFLYRNGYWPERYYDYFHEIERLVWDRTRDFWLDQLQKSEEIIENLAREFEVAPPPFTLEPINVNCNIREAVSSSCYEGNWESVQKSLFRLANTHP
jgi:hypothetical protein